MTIKGIGRGAREVFLTFGALLGVLCIIATIAGVAFGVKPLVFRSGSMSPAIHTGDLAVSRTVNASDLKVGDIVSVVNAEGNRVTHRLVNIARQGDERQLTLKGDDNKVADAEVYTVKKAERVLFDIPKAGYVVNAAASPVGVFVLGAYVTMMLLLVFRRRGPTDGDGPSPEPRRKGGARKADKKGAQVTPRMIATTAFAAAIAVATPAAAAPWTDDVVIGGGTYTAYTVTKPAITSCTVTGGALSQKTATIVWTEVSSPYALDYTATIVETGQTMTVTDNGSTRQVQFSAGLLSTILNATYNIRIQASLPSPNGTWKSVVSNQPVTITLLGLGMSCGTAT
ncbi:signal peptidase I [Aeromicrobium panaciterrae]|uniref:Signal peptidase I n=1 Tax=Aeromicrobium panaciterrae TaxID=363861 RepID=A0ABU1UNI7_9ACTN|nr:signal peptidase I [Aeromicrobium panaciterrae]MDR7086719.1 signal peptidase I [Aeromicrobium panaciterrae]